MIEDFDRCYQVMQSRDPGYDGVFFVGVRTTGIYCRPSCPARLPKRENVRLFPTAAAARSAGLRACKRCDPDAARRAVERRLAFREPFDAQSILSFLHARAVAGVESVDATTYRRSLRLDHGGGLVELTPEPDAVRCVLRVADPGDLDGAVARCRRLLDLDADPASIDGAFEGDRVLGALVRERPGLRVPGCVEGFEIAVRAIVGQQVSVAGARTTLGKLVERYGEPLAAPSGGVTHRFPTAEALAAADPAAFPMPRTRAEALRAVAGAVAGGDVCLEDGADPAATLDALRRLRGIGPWTASYIGMRALGDPDVFLPGDLGVRHALARLGHDGGADAADRLARAWRPWRSYAVMHLSASLALPR